MITNVSNLQIPATAPISFTKCSNNVVTLPANTAVEIVNENTKRLYAAFINNSKHPISLILGERTAGTMERGILLNPGGSFEINLMNLYRGKVSALCLSTAKLSFVECE